ncbi:MAG: ribose-phosphate pyrophosphokinase [Nanoarchaeota archaeon]
MYSTLKIFSGNSNKQLAQQIADYLHRPLGKIDVGPFPNGETRVEILESVRGQNVFLIQSTSIPANENLMELLLMIDAFKRASTASVNVVVPFYGYSKQDKKKTGREPISARLVADLIEKAGATRIITVELHSGQIQGFFNIPVDDLSTDQLMADYFRQKRIEDLVIVSPDVGGAKRARDAAVNLNAGLAIIDKHRSHYSKAQAMAVIGDVEGKNCLIFDDFVDTAGSVVEAVQALKKSGAKDVYLFFTHPVLTQPPAIDRLKGLDVKEIVTTDTIQLPPDKKLPNMTILSTSTLLGETIRRVAIGESVSELYKGRK